MIACFLYGINITHYGISDGQNITGNNNKYLRYIWEVSKTNSGKEHKWVPIAKGGSFRRWYGNIEDVIDWSFEARQEYKNNPVARIQDEYLWYRTGITWNLICSGKSGTGFRILPKDYLFNKAAPTIVMKYENIDMTNYILAYLNTRVVHSIMNLMNPTFNTNIAEVFTLKLRAQDSLKAKIDNITLQNISISRQDWDAHENSWDFQRNELLNMDDQVQKETLNNTVEKHFKETREYICIDTAEPHPDNIEWCVEQYKKKWEQMFNQLHTNEEELNRQFIEIYGLQDELTPDVPIDEITILQQGEISFVPSAEGEDAPKVMKWNDDVIIKQLISYAVGCMMGRYRLDKPGLHIAHPEPTAEEIAPYSYHGRKYEIDDDGILPLMNSDCGFSDNAPLRMADFVRIAFGEETQVENLNYMEQCLGKTLEQYFVKDFWKDHKKMYQNRPIYWLFASKKGTFQVIAYMHRMNAYTVERIRAKYLLPFIEHLEQEIKKLDMRRAELTTKESKQLQTLQKQLDECREYHERLQVVAEQAISFDLDDGVVANYAKFGDVLQKIK